MFAIGLGSCGDETSRLDAALAFDRVKADEGDVLENREVTRGITGPDTDRWKQQLVASLHRQSGIRQSNRQIGRINNQQDNPSLTSNFPTSGQDQQDCQHAKSKRNGNFTERGFNRTNR